MWVEAQNITWITVNKLVDVRRESSDVRQRDTDAILEIDTHALKSKSTGLFCSLLAQWRQKMASNMAGIASLVLFLFCSLCLAKDKPTVIPPQLHKLTNENWDRILKGEWMVKL